jgi:hypothetical protein
MGLDGDNPLALIQASTTTGTITTVADLLEILTIRSFNKRFNSSLMFMPSAKESTSKGVIEFNEGLEADPEAVNKDAYGAGWMIKVKMSNPAEVDALLDAAAYEALIG